MRPASHRGRLTRIGWLRTFPPAAASRRYGRISFLGLQAAGECLIDDLSVVNRRFLLPLRSSPTAISKNGITGWRAIGTHGRSRVET
jgi:hypothetical protein